MIPSIPHRPVTARTCVLLGGSGQSRPYFTDARPLAALLLQRPTSRDATASNDETRHARS